MYFLERLENATTREQHEIFDQDGVYSIDHIMPQTLSDEWRRELGEDWQGVHERWLHRLANLTLTAYNPSYSNTSFTRKRDMQDGYRESGLRLNSYLAQLERWDEAALQARQEHLLEEALAIWPRPVSGYCPPRPPEESLTPQEWKDASDSGQGDLAWGRKIVRFVFCGQEYQSKGWRNMYRIVVNMLYDKDPEVIMELVQAPPGKFGDLTRDFSTTDKDPRRAARYEKIDEGVYFYNGHSPWPIMRRLCLLLPRFQLDLSVLIMYFKPRPGPETATDDAVDNEEEE